MIAQFSWLDEMCNRKNSPEHDADSCYDNVRDAEERVLAANNSTCGYDDGFRAAVLSDVEI